MVFEAQRFFINSHRKEMIRFKFMFQALVLVGFILMPIQIFAINNIPTTEEVARLLESQRRISVDDIVAEYHQVRSRRLNGYYGKKGGRLMKEHEHNIANHLSLRINASSCQDIKNYLPSIDPGYYHFKSTSGLVNSRYCGAAILLWTVL